MYIKIKRIKQFSLILLCIFFAGYNYFGYVNANDSDTDTCNKTLDADCDGLTDSEEKLYKTDYQNADTDGDGYSDGVEVKSGYDPLKPAPDDKINSGTAADEESAGAASKTNLTDIYTQKILDLVSNKNGSAISTGDVNAMADEMVANYMGEEISIDSLPQIDTASLKILKQNYSSLSEESQNQKKREDAVRYLGSMVYLLVNNSPTPISTKEDLEKFKDDFFDHLADAGNMTADMEYFTDLGERLDTFVLQAQDVEVPESMVDLHVKFLRIAKGFLSLKDLDIEASDPLGRMVMFSKASQYAELLGDFFKNDFLSYFNNLSENE